MNKKNHVRVSESGNKDTCELWMLEEDQPFYAQLESIAIQLSEEDSSGYLTTITTISEDMGWEKKLKHVANFPYANPNPVLRASVEGRILYANSASSHLLNLWGCRVNQLLPESLLKMVADIFHNNLRVTHECTFGHYIYSLTFAPVAKEGYVNIYGLDLTQHKRMEQELLQARKLQAMGVMTSGVAHEFNNILAIVDGKIQMLMRGNNDKENFLEEFRLIRKTIKDGAEIVRRINKFAKIKEDRHGYVPVDLREVIKETIDLTLPNRKWHSKKTRNTYAVNSDGVKRVSCIKGNPLELQEVLINIINNAIDAMPDGGTLSFSTKEDGGNVIVNISDTGLGMDEETQSKLFDPFFTTKDHGTGLGMSIVFEIVKRHRGEIAVQSQMGKGSTFILSFPATKEPPGITQNAPEPDREKSGNSYTREL
ncbi:MAG: GHKL domain-containing protein [Candidatus Kuenenia sp.]|nr:GHKL domain-containing protein [Candidatus Kuenenia hertensis]